MGFTIKGNRHAVKVVCKQGTLLTSDNIGRFIAHTNEQEQSEIRMMLMNYKKEHFDAGNLIEFILWIVHYVQKAALKHRIYIEIDCE